MKKYWSWETEIARMLGKERAVGRWEVRMQQLGGTCLSWLSGYCRLRAGQ
jgi:hypothetical protein